MKRKNYNVKARSCQFTFCLLMLIAVFHCFSTSALFAQTLTQIEVLTTDEGLPFRNVSSITQDSTGAMWFGTTQGLIKYDGYTFKIYNSDSNNPNFIDKELLTDHNTIYRNHNIIWFVANNALFTINTKSDSIVDYTVLDGLKGDVFDLHIDYNKQVWVVTDNHWSSKKTESYQYLQKYKDGLGFEVVDSVSRGNREFTGLTSDQDNNLWWSTFKDGTIKYDEEGNLIELYKFDKTESRKKVHYRGISFFNNKNKHYYFPSNQGITSFNSSQETWEVVFDESVSFNHAVEVKDGNIWFASDDLLYRMDRWGKFTDFTQILQSHLNYSRIAQFFIDNSGLLWIATDNGLIKLRIKPKIFKHLLHANNKDWGNAMRSILETKEGDLIALCENDKKLVVFDKVTLEHKDLELWGDYPKTLNPLVGARFITLDLDKEYLYTVNESLVKIRLKDGFTKMISNYSDRLNSTGQNPITTLKDGRLLFGFTLSRLTLYDPSTGDSERVFKGNIKKDILHIRFFKESKIQGIVWIGTFNDGLLKVNINGTVEAHYHINSDPHLTKNNIMVIHENEDESIWFGTFGGGLNHLIPDEKKLITYDQSLGLANDNVVGIIPYKDHHMLVSTYNGLSIFNTKTKIFQNFYEEDGLTNNEFNYSSFYNDSQGNYYFGGMNGINKFKPQDLIIDKPLNSLRFTSLSKFNSKSNKVQLIDFSFTPIPKLNILPNDQYFQIYWTTSNFFKNKSTQYLTKLEGFENNWISQGINPYVRYNKLPAGNYLLKVKGIDFSGAESKNILQIPLTVKQVFYKTWWFFAATTLVIISIFYALFKLRVRQLLALEQLRTKISIDLHDDLGSMLSGIAMQSEILGSNAKKEDKSKLNKISQLSRDAISSMRDLVWSIDNRRERVSDLFERMQELAEELLLPSNIRFQLEKNDINLGKKLPPLAKQHLFFIYKEAITNILRHSDAQNVVVSFINSNGFGNVIIKDDGSIQKFNKSTGFGLANMSLRAEKMKATIDFIRDDGFEIHIKLPFKF